MERRSIILALLALLALAGEAQAQCSGQPAGNTVCAAPNGAAGLPNFRSLLQADFPFSDPTNASNLTSGTVAAARGGAGTINGALKGNGSGVVSQAACADLSNASASCATDATNATNIGSGTLAAARGGAGTITGALRGNGSGTVTQAACADLSNAAASCATDATNATNIGSGSLANARLTTGHVVAGTGLTGGSLAGGGTVAADLATAAQFRSGTANKLLAADAVFTSEVAVTYGTTTTFDFSTFINASVTLTGNITTVTLTNIKAGQAGIIRFIQDGTGSRTIPTTFNTNFKCAGGCNYVLSTAINAVDVLGYTCLSTSYCVGGALLKDVK